MAFALDFLGGVAGFVGKQIDTKMTADLQASADEKKAKLLNKLQQSNIKLEQDLLGKREEKQQTALYDRALAEQAEITKREAAKQAELNQRAIDERAAAAAIASGNNATSRYGADTAAASRLEAARLRAANKVGGSRSPFKDDSGGLIMGAINKMLRR